MYFLSAYDLFFMRYAAIIYYDGECNRADMRESDHGDLSL